MNGKMWIAAFLLVLAAGEMSAQLSTKAGNCPLSHTVFQCNPSCVTDYQCGSNEKCCPNKCGGKSCASPSAVSTGDDGISKRSNGGNRGEAVYCEGRLCRTGEKCQFDRSTKREKCVRA